jgi:hypothetical protein
MSITISVIRQGASGQTVFFVLARNGESFKFHGDVPDGLTEAQTAAWLAAREDEIYLLILRRLYPEADVSKFQKPDVRPLDVFLAWIKAGCKNPDGKIIAKEPWVSTHPPMIALKAELDAATTVAQVKAVLAKIIAEGL